MIEAAALMALIVRDWGDFTMITSLLLFNALLGFWEEHEASNALDALKSSLALKARALRDGKWQQVDARTLVLGDIIRLYLGDVVPADCKLIQGDYISIDQSALTGESLPVTKKSGEAAYSGSVVTMTLGARMLARSKAIVSRLESIEELAGVDVFCSDKTRTLTENKLTLGEPESWAGTEAATLILMASLASRAADTNPIDIAVWAGLKDVSILNSYQQEKYVPFDPVDKRTEATMRLVKFFGLPKARHR